ncbi:MULTISPECIES: phage capsid protein [unclassified Oceanispirochaeta]|uniref:phage capsid protein n=1 Tax=unclassified Oceanispirochaeta TaxID=2635722 RepID=UPI000E08EF62|nr:MULTISPECIES: phage capsid protein [unclassified Oceanispirochaeta]MBF9018958.1 hypothetical protein [Oceanispirochaeta sp. M2]NPD75450.1 hypothetical protein [Oceanispirochaeta sp. M1]RDG28700.1 hypothetical protein DV872_25485 [Oceanispirochaeta sp. M1]
MAITTLNQELWSTLLLKGTQEQLCFQEVVKDIGKVNGKQVHFSNIGAVTVSDYTKDTDISNQTLTDSGIDLDLNQQKYFSVNVDDVDDAQTDSNIMAEIIRKGTHGLKSSIDSYIASLHAGAGITTGLGSSTTPIEINSANVLTYLRTISRKLDEANADPSTRWVVIPPFMKEDLLIALPALDTANSEILATGYIGSLYGLKIYNSNNVVNTTNAKYKVMAGDKDAFRFGMNIEKMEGLRNNAQFGDIVRALMVYGCKVTQASTLALLTANEAAEA